MSANDIDTPRVFERPVVNPSNRAMVMVIHNLALTLEASGRTLAATPKALLDIAKTIQLATEPLTDLQRELVAQILDEHARALVGHVGEVKQGAKEVRET